MLLILDQSLIEIDFSIDANIHLIEKILDTGIAGKHAIQISRQTNDALQQIDLNKRYKAYLRKLKNDYAFGRLESFLQCSIVIKHGIAIAALETLEDQHQQWSIPFEQDHIKFLLDASIIICEQEKDCEILEIAAIHYKIKHKLNSVELNCTRRIGGGGNTSAVLRNTLQNEQKICLCIVDGDLYFPGSAKGSTYRSCKNELQQNNWYAHLDCLEVREIENIFPIRVIKESLEGNAVLSNKFDSLVQRLGNKVSTHWIYLDLKHGIKASWLLALNENGRLFWDIQNVINTDECELCIENQSCRDQVVCDTQFIFHGICADLLAHVADWLNSRGQHSSLQSFKDGSSEWLRIGKLIFSFCAAKPRYIL